MRESGEGRGRSVDPAEGAWDSRYGQRGFEPGERQVGARSQGGVWWGKSAGAATNSPWPETWLSQGAWPAGRVAPPSCRKSAR